MSSEDSRERLRALFAKTHADAVEVFEHVLPQIATMLDKMTAPQKERTVIVLADLEDSEGRLLAQEILSKQGLAGPTGPEPIMYLLRPAELVIEAMTSLGRTPLPPLLESQPPPGEVRVLVVTNGTHYATVFRSRLSPGGTA